MSPLDQWYAETLRLTFFTTSNSRIDFKSLTGESPSEVSDRPKDGIRIQQGPFDGGILFVREQAGRVYLIHAPIERVNADTGPSLRVLGKFQDAMDRFMWASIGRFKGVTHVGLRAVGLAPKPNMAATFDFIQTSMLSNMRLDLSGTSDFFFQINRPGEFAGVPYNRLCKWSTTEPSKGNDSTWSSKVGGCRVEIDIETVLGSNLPKKWKCNGLIEKFASVAMDVLRDGDQKN